MCVCDTVELCIFLFILFFFLSEVFPQVWKVGWVAGRWECSVCGLPATQRSVASV